MTALVYIIPAVAAVFIGWLLWKNDNPPSFGYVAFALFGGTLLFVVMVDTKWLERAPAIEWGGQRYGVIQKQLMEIRNSVVGYETEVIKASSLGSLYDGRLQAAAAEDCSNGRIRTDIEV